MKSYIEPMSAADALDVLRVFCEPFGDLSYSYNNDEDAVLHGPDGDKVLKTPDEVIAVMGDDATREIAEHKRFRERAVRPSCLSGDRSTTSAPAKLSSSTQIARASYTGSTVRKPRSPPWSMRARTASPTTRRCTPSRPVVQICSI